MILWTVQPLVMWDILETKGVLRANTSRIKKQMPKYHLNAYQWLSKEMCTRIGPPPLKGTKYPLWAWYQYWGKKKKKPDLRCCHLLKGEKGVRIEFEMDEKNVLLSDFHAWHFVLNNWHLAITKKEEINFLLGSRRETFGSQKTKKKSWENIFKKKELNFVTGPQKTRSIQATFWELRVDQVRKTTFYKER